ncbi:MAG: GGDEF domain-containing phosphodiesterase [Methylotenera sp.]
MASYKLKAANVTGDYAFNLQMFNELIHEPPFNEAKFTLAKLLPVATIWPQQMNWPEFNHRINHLLQAWLNDYDSGAHLDSALLLARCLTLRPAQIIGSTDLIQDSIVTAKFQNLLMHLLARVTNQFDQYKFTHIQNFDLETGLPNQQLMLNILNKHLQVEHQNHGLSSTHIGLILVNLNISLGEGSQLNATSSSLIMAAVHTIKQQLNENSTVCRVGPIELAIITRQVRFPAQLNLITSKIIHAFESALPLDNITLILKPYFGGVSSLKTQQNGVAMYDCAKLALHHAMVNNYDTEFYDQHITESFSNSHQLDEEIIHALQQNELEIYLQPIISLQNKKSTNPMMQEANSKVTCVSAEVLLRWHNESLQSTSPQRLIDTIYKKGFGKVFIRWLINNACQRVAELKSAHQRNIALTINLSGTDLLDADLPELLAQSIALWEIPAENLIIEITENDLLIDEAKATLVIDKIVALGCKLALDDFGTGYSSMTRLRSMPIHLVKIDQSFVRNIANSSQDKAIVLSVVKLAHSLGKAVVAEGVEDIACLNILKEMKCEKIQGYYYAKPMHFDAFIPWLSEFEDEQLNLKPNSLTATDNTLI